MIRFINKNGEVFDGRNPYIHWAPGQQIIQNVFEDQYPYVQWAQCQQSTGLWYTITLNIITEYDNLSSSELDPNSIFKFADPTKLVQGSEPLVLSEILTTSYSQSSQGVVYRFEDKNFYIYQILVVCSSDISGEFTESFTLTSGPDSITVTVGADFYDEDEILSINLSNRGADIPNAIQKAFLSNNVHEDKVDGILINRKFKELISNYLDILDNKGSYDSLRNSLKWFEWGSNVKIYEIWEGLEGMIEKELKLTLEDEYKNLLSSHRKTTHLSLVAALQKITDANDLEHALDEEKNPIVESVAYQWSKEDIILKISILGAFFERYFMPIHLDLMRASAEALVFTNSIKVVPGTMSGSYAYLDDTGVVEIEMEHTVTLGNLDMVGVGPDTVFGKQWEYVPTITNGDFNLDYNGDFFTAIGTLLDPIGVSPMKDIDALSSSNNYSDADNETGTFFAQLRGGVGVMVPITVTVPLPADDAIICETLTVWRDDNEPSQIQERRIWIPEADRWDEEGHITRYSSKFTFNLVSTKEELVKFTLVLHSVSGHTWTAASSYQAIDVSGSFLHVCRVANTDSTGATPKYTSIDQWLQGNPFGTQYNTIIYDPSTPNPNPILNNDNTGTFTAQSIVHYIPTENIDQYNELVLVENELSGSTYDISWINSNITDRYWILDRGPEDNQHNHKYETLISKKPGWTSVSKGDFITNTGISESRIKRFELVYIPQLHTYTSLDNINITKNNYGYVMDNTNYLFSQNDLICVFPQFRKTLPVDISSIRWEFKNESTREVINYNIPISTPLIARNIPDLLSPGYWTVTMFYKLSNSNTEHTLIKKSAFKLE